MNRGKHLWVFVAGFLLTGSAAFAGPTQVLIIRHAEKPASGDDLSPGGYARAQALVKYFQTTTAVLDYGTPAAIYAMSPKTKDAKQDPDLPQDPGSDKGDQAETTSERPIETVTPLANALGMEVRHPYTKDQTAPLVSEIMSNSDYDGKMVLICWEHKMITSLDPPGVLVSFDSGLKEAPWPDDDFWSVDKLDFVNGALSRFTTFSQALMPGDPGYGADIDDQGGE